MAKDVADDTFHIHEVGIGDLHQGLLSCVSPSPLLERDEGDPLREACCRGELVTAGKPVFVFDSSTVLAPDHYLMLLGTLILLCFLQCILLFVLVKMEGNKEWEVQSGSKIYYKGLSLKAKDLFSVAPEKSKYFAWEGKGKTMTLKIRLEC